MMVVKKTKNLSTTSDWKSTIGVLSGLDLVTVKATEYDLHHFHIHLIFQ